jgi:hypothetical protein
MTLPWNKLIFYYHPIFLEHLHGLRHPENPERLTMIVQHLQEKGIWQQLNIKAPAPAELKWIETNHSPSYIRSIEESCHRAPVILDGGDTLVTARSYEAALYAVGACLGGVDDLMNDRANSVFCAVRPPSSWIGMFIMGMAPRTVFMKMRKSSSAAFMNGRYIPEPESPMKKAAGLEWATR